MSKFTTYNHNGKLEFIIEEGPFKGVEYRYESLTEAGLKYHIDSKKQLVNNSNKYLFENEIREILKEKLGK